MTSLLKACEYAKIYLPFMFKKHPGTVDLPRVLGSNITKFLQNNLSPTKLLEN